MLLSRELSCCSYIIIKSLQEVCPTASRELGAERSSLYYVLTPLTWPATDIHGCTERGTVIAALQWLVAIAANEGPMRQGTLIFRLILKEQ